MSKKNRKNVAPVTVEQVEETQVVDTQIEDTNLPEVEVEEELPFGPDDEGINIPATEPEAEPENEQTEEQKKGYRVVGTARICDLNVGQMYKREGKNCKIWTVVLKEAGEPGKTGKMLVSSSPKNIHNPRKEFDMEVVVIELV